MQSLDLTNRQLGPYKLRRLLGMGGMGGVYESYQESVGRKVAVKTLPFHLAQQPGYLERFNREVELAASLEHINILPIYDHGTYDGISYIVMRLLTGGDLQKRLEKLGRPSMAESKKLLRQIGDALDYAHSRGVIHRDLKAANIMFDERGNAYLTDFGIAKVFGATGLTGTDQILGTPMHMAPEQWRSEPVDARTDLYSLAIVAYHVLTGNMPFQSDTPHGMMFKHLNEMPPLPSSLQPDLPSQVNDVLGKGLAKNPDDRYMSTGEFVTALNRAIGFSSDYERDETGFATTHIDTGQLALHETAETLSGTTFSPTPVETEAMEMQTLDDLPKDRIDSRPARRSPLPDVPDDTGGRPGWMMGIIVLIVICVVVVGGMYLAGSLGSGDAGEKVSSRSTRTELIPDTLTPAPTNTPTSGPLVSTPGQFLIPGTKTITPVPPLATPEQAEVALGFEPITRNADWTPVEQDFDGVTMVLVPVGCFMMGSTDEQISYAISLGGVRDWFTQEQPVHEQCFEEPFWIDKYEVTNDQFERLGGVAANNSKWIDGNRPHERITWFEARDFCELRNGRLPTEREWEYAARGPDALVYPWGNEFVADNVVYKDNNSEGQTAIVGSRPGGASWVGALDMSGNVWEWTSTIYEGYSYPYDAADGRENNSDMSIMRALRGGSWSKTDIIIRAANRNSKHPDTGYSDDGFRCFRFY